MKIEKIIAKKDKGDFLNYTPQGSSYKQRDNCNLMLLVDLIRTNIFKEIYEYEIGQIIYPFGSSDDWSVRYGDNQDDNDSYISFYDYWVEQSADDGNSGIQLNKLNSLKIMTKNNLLDLIQSWFIIVQKKPQYIVITRDDKGLITLEYKETLSIEDQHYNNI